jgi:hypothetical protein
MILEQLGLFWGNTEVVLEALKKKGQHTENFVSFARNPKLLDRFKERLVEYRCCAVHPPINHDLVYSSTFNYLFVLQLTQEVLGGGELHVSHVSNGHHRARGLLDKILHPSGRNHL